MTALPIVRGSTSLRRVPIQDPVPARLLLLRRSFLTHLPLKDQALRSYLVVLPPLLLPLPPPLHHGLSIASSTNPSLLREPIPNNRSPYPKFLVPKSYFCFLGRLQDLPSDNPSTLPHSCGEVCEKLLNQNRGHRCLLLCHHGPGHSGPQSVKAACFFGKTRDVRCCSHKYFSCGKKCGRLLDCGVHSCRGMCHEGMCPPCKEIGVYRCQCGRVEGEKECCDKDFRCDAACKKLLACGYRCHVRGSV